MYYKTKKLATSNGRIFHIAAILLRKGDVVKIGENTTKTHPRFKRYYNDGSSAACMHAEMNVLRFAKPGDVIEVLRFSKKDHSLTMAKPCELCMKEMRKSEIKKVRYTNWQGEWEEIIIDP